MFALACLLWLIAACDPPAPPTDAGAGGDAGACGGRCDDGLFCNGEEVCDPSSPAADEDGCIPATEPACAAAETCSEPMDRCLAEACEDADDDGYPEASCAGSGGDCDDEDASRHPGAIETCDGAGLDEDCDPCTVGGGESDADGDGFPSATCVNRYLGTVPMCGGSLVDVEVGTVRGTDCDDLDMGISLDDPEVGCNREDDDCDGSIDEDGAPTFFRDADGDGFGDPASVPRAACTAPAGYVDNTLDCDDTTALSNPSAGEMCDGLDNNCNGTIDEGLPFDTYFRDGDGDSWGTSETTRGCRMPTGHAARAGDCDDARPTVYPGATESCNARDDNCNGVADFAIAGFGYEDDDADGYADVQCPGVLGDDCDDAIAEVHPTAIEVCNDRDEDCDGVIDVAPSAAAECAAAEHLAPGTAMCNAGVCSATCETGFASCDGVLTPTNGCEIDTRTTNAHCGVCGRVCATGLVCSAGACGTAVGRQRIAAAQTFTCVLRGGAVHCWGAGAFRAVAVAGVTGAVEVRGRMVVTSAGRAHRIDAPGDGTFTAVDLGRTDVAQAVEHRDAGGTPRYHLVTSDGSVAYFDGATTTRVITNVVGAVQIAVDPTTRVACALRRDGTRACWSDHALTAPALTIAAGPFTWLDDRGCALSSGTGRIDCAGTVTAGFTSAVMASGRCAVTSGGGALCTGTNVQGEVGDGTTTARTTPTAVVDLTGATQIAAGSSWACALDGSDGVRCWGSHWQTGIDRRPYRTGSVAPPLTGITQITEVGEFVAGGRVYRFPTGASAPTDWRGLTDASSVSPMGQCYRTTGGAVRCIGNDGYGQLGNGDPLADSPSAWVTASGLGSGASFVTGTYYSAMALRADGGVVRWGIQNFGRSTPGPGTAVSSPEYLFGGASQLVSSYETACARVSGQLTCWGTEVNDTTGFTSDTVTPRTLPGITGVTDFALRNDGGIAVIGGGLIFTWGHDLGGLLGDGPAVSGARQYTFPGTYRATRVFASGSTLGAILTDGSVIGWGQNGMRQLGDGTTSYQYGPVVNTALAGVTGIVEVTVMPDGGCARLSDGTARCWGEGDYGVPQERFISRALSVVGP